MVRRRAGLDRICGAELGELLGWKAGLVQTFWGRQRLTFDGAGLSNPEGLCGADVSASREATFRVFRGLKVSNFDAFSRRCLFLCSHTNSFLCWLFVWGQ